VLTSLKGEKKRKVMSLSEKVVMMDKCDMGVGSAAVVLWCE
jgi:hypothetical protein